MAALPRSLAGPGHLRLGLTAGLCALVAVLAAGSWSATAHAQAPIVVFEETFENGVGTTPVLLTDYTGAAGETYTADPPWLTGCNGNILAFNSPDADVGATTCTLGNYRSTKELAAALGTVGGTDPNTNHAVTAYTAGNPGANLVEFETVTPIVLAQTNRFLTFSVDAVAVNCAASAPLYSFYLMDGATEIPAFTTPINPCTHPDSGPVPVPSGGTVPGGSFAADGAILFTGAELGIRLRNGNGSGRGNDAAFDNIRILDVSPTLHKTFGPSPVLVGDSATLTFEIANTDELGAKQGWSFTDHLPSGLVLADPSGATTTCANGNVNAPAGGGSIAVSGDLEAGEASCEVSVNVTSARRGTYENCPANVTPVGLNGPECDSIRFVRPRLAIKKKAGKKNVRPGQVVPYRIAVRNKGKVPAEPVRVCDRLPKGLKLLRAPKATKTAARRACWRFPSLDPGAKRTFRVIAQVKNGTRPGVLRNTAIANSKKAKRKRSKAKVRVRPAVSVCPSWKVSASC